MSRSNGPGVPPQGWPSAQPPGQNDPYQDPQYAPRPAPQGQASGQIPGGVSVAAGRQPRLQTAPPSRVPQVGLQPGQLPGGYPAPQQAQPPYGTDPNYGYGQGYPAQPAYGQPPQQPQSYGAPAFAPQHVPQTQPPARQTQPAPHAPYQADPRYGAYPPGYGASDVPQTAPPTRPPAVPQQTAAYAPAYGNEPSQRGYQPAAAQPGARDQWGQPTAPPNLDPQGYDLGHYMPATSPPRGAEPQTQRPTAQSAYAPAPAWTPNEGFGQPTTGRPAAPEYADPYAAVEPRPAQGASLEPAYSEEYEDDDYEEAPKRTRYGLIAASLIGAIAVGGGLAYAYKAFVAPSQQVASTPVVKGGTGPVKVKPADPGGTKFANSDNKVMDSSLSGSASASADGGPRKVETYRIERDGTIGTPSATSSAPPPPSAPVQPIAAAAATATASPVAGTMVILPPARPVPSPAPVAAEAAPAPSPPRPPQKMAAAQPVAAPVGDATEAAPAAAAAKKPPVKKPAPPAALGASPGTSGFVAVLASVPASASSRIQAMQQFADLQQKYNGVLGGKAPEVVEAKLEKGVYHRLVAGPPASREAATSVCSQLKAAGYTADCWVTAF
jgi:SPOR domain